ncbi:sugar phosphate isomerase/epimerase [Gramella sp. AN32]|uniref:Sugar phosphate isomerase/epimerase family protein n=1 Tax=Christiangramia antarctica TaxID=2058158 RepID=A0ABW5X524_9FLAO|nr:sugar phosphate isomerase/epimerase [Gramella sp. AN32]
MKKNPEEVLKKLFHLGFKEIELYGYLNGKFWNLNPKELMKIINRYNLISSSGHYALESMLNGDIDEIHEIIEVSKILNHKYIVVPSIPINLRKSHQDYRAIADILNKAGELCNKSNFKLAYHNHAFEFEKLNYLNITPYEFLLKNTEPDLVSFEIDIYWVINMGICPKELFRKFPGRFKLWHIKDMDKNDHNLTTEIGYGKIDFENLLEYKKLSGGETFILEQEHFNIEPYESLKISQNYISKTLKF